MPPKRGLASAFPSREGSTIFIDSWHTLRSMPWDSMIVIMGNSHLKFEHYLILNRLLQFNSEFTPEKWWERKTILSDWVPSNVSGAFPVRLLTGSSDHPITSGFR